MLDALPPLASRLRDYKKPHQWRGENEIQGAMMRLQMTIFDVDADNKLLTTWSQSKRHPISIISTLR